MKVSKEQLQKWLSLLPGNEFYVVIEGLGGGDTMKPNHSVLAFDVTITVTEEVIGDAKPLITILTDRT